MGKVKLLKIPFRFSDAPVEPESPPPRFTASIPWEILNDVIGASEQEISSLREKGVIE